MQDAPDQHCDAESALYRARLGSRKWNEWAKDKTGWTFDFSNVDFRTRGNDRISFKGFIFPGKALFHGAKFGPHFGFDRAEFHGEAVFEGAIFEASSIFYKTVFVEDAFFINANFYGLARFTEARFKKEVDFDIAHFRMGALFKSTVFENKATFRGAEFLGGNVTFDKAEFEREVDFSDSCFEKEASFIGGACSDVAHFRGVRFQDHISFDLRTFTDVVEFNGSKFDGALGLADATFHKEANFDSCRFGYSVSLVRTEFDIVPNFQSTRVDFHVSMDSIQVKFGGERLCRFWERSKGEDDAPKYRRLKEMAILAQDHRQEQNFFTMEQKAMRGTRYKGLAVIPSLLYETFSDFGRSLARPAGCLLGVWLLFAAAYFKAVPTTRGVHISLFGAKQISLQEWLDFLSSLGGLISSAMLYSASQILPFVSASREVKARAVKHLFDDKVPDCLGWLNITEGLLAFIFLFLIGLALRNRFRI